VYFAHVVADLFGTPCGTIAKTPFFWQGSGNNSATTPEENLHYFVKVLNSMMVL
jgi:hypothetical protein